jgi:hypothetical protein
MADIILIPRSHHGGRYFYPIVPGLRDAGHRVFPLTPTGVGDRRHLTNGPNQIKIESLQRSGNLIHLH